MTNTPAIVALGLLLILLVSAMMFGGDAPVGDGMAAWRDMP